MRYTQGAGAESAAGRKQTGSWARESEGAAPQPEIHVDLLYPARRVLSTAYRIKI